MSLYETALNEWHVAHGGRMVEFAGWHMPIQYTSIVDEHQAVRQRVGLFDISHMGRLWFSGPDHVAFLDHVLTNHVAVMKDGQIRYSLVCREDGGILDDILVYRYEAGCLMVVNGANREKIVEWFNKHIGSYDATFVDRTFGSSMIAIQGPLAEELLQKNSDIDLSEIRYYGASKGKIFGIPTVISRTGYTGESGFEIIVDQQYAVPIWEKLIEAGAAVGIAPCGLGCRDTLRFEAGMPLYGHEMDESVDPYSAGLGFSVKLDKPDFIGKKALEEIKNSPNRRTRIGLQLAGKRIARQGSEVYAGNEKIGVVASGTFSPTLQLALAMALVDLSHAELGTELEIDIRGNRVPATVVKYPFYKRS